jgi:hypothetical protein
MFQNNKSWFSYKECFMKLGAGSFANELILMVVEMGNI